MDDRKETVKVSTSNSINTDGWKNIDKYAEDIEQAELRELEKLTIFRSKQTCSNNEEVDLFVNSEENDISMESRYRKRVEEYQKALDRKEVTKCAISILASLPMFVFVTFLLSRILSLETSILVGSILYGFIIYFVNLT